VSVGVTQSAMASKEITQNITGVDSAARQTAQGAAQTQTAGVELSKLAEELQTLVGQFKV
jgi:methyl-accepting chemotaxis protein